MDKNKRQKRFQQKQRHIRRQAKNNKQIFKFELKEPHRRAKLSFATCGDPNCAMCGNPRKFFGEVTVQEKRFVDLENSYQPFERYHDEESE